VRASISKVLFGFTLLAGHAPPARWRDPFAFPRLGKLLRGLVTGLAGLWLGAWVCQPLDSHAQGSDQAYTVEYTGTADFSSPAVYGRDEKSNDFAAGSDELHVAWTAVGSGLFADAQLIDDPTAINLSSGAFLRFTSLTGTRSITEPDGPATSSKHNCTSTLSQVPGATLPYVTGLEVALTNLMLESFVLGTVAPLDGRYVQRDGPASSCSIPLGRLFALPYDDPQSVANDDRFIRATRPVFFTPPTQAGERSFDQADDYNFDLETGYIRFKKLDGSLGAPVGTWKVHIQSTIRVRSIPATNPDNIFGDP